MGLASEVTLQFLFSLLPPANEFCEGYVFTSVCQSFCSQGGALQAPRPTPRGEVEGSGLGGSPGPHPGDLQAHTQGGSPGPHPGGSPSPHPGGLQAYTRGSRGPHLGGSPGSHLGGSPGPHLEGSQHALRQAPPAVDGYCYGQYASYWNAFLFN